MGDNQGDHDPFSHISHAVKRAWLRVYAETGNKSEASRTVGISIGTPYSEQWRFDEEFQDAVEIARMMAGDALEAEAIRRARIGLRRQKFNKDGTAIRDPETCDCGHDRRGWHPVDKVGGEKVHGACVHPACEGCEEFVPGYYFEHEYSDTLLIFLMKGQLPETYGDKLRITGALARMDLSRLPDALLKRIADGEPPEAVLASAIQEGHGSPAELLGMPSLKPGARKETGRLKDNELVQEPPEEDPSEDSGGAQDSEGDDQGERGRR